jgi:diguanylate cyclase (GGDEF)-like protein
MRYYFYYPHILILFLASLSAFLMAGILFRKKQIPAAVYLGMVFISIGIWLFAGVFETAGLTQKIKIFWTQVGYIGLLNIMPFLFVFVMKYFQKDQQLHPKTLYWVWLVPVLVLILVWTNAWHGWVWTAFSEISSDFNIMIYEHGFVFWIAIFYMYTLVFGSLIVLLREYYVYQHKPYRTQIILMIAAILLPLIASLVYLVDMYPIAGLDWILLSMFLSTMLVAVSVLWFGFIDLLPIARDILVENLESGVLVVDQYKRIVDHNQRFVDYLNVETQGLFGLDVCAFLSSFGLEPKQRFEQKFWREEIQIHNDQTRYLELVGRPIKRTSQTPQGWLLVFNDITSIKEKELEVQETNRKLMVQLAETERLKDILEEQAVRDSLTNLYNRRFLEDTLEREIARAIRNIHFIALLMLDIDYFKMVNDQHGHDVGDQVLCVMAEVLTSCCRKEDVACRFGGEEFLLLIPNISVKAASARAEEIRSTFIQRCKDLSEQVNVTVSIGISMFPQHADTAKTLFRRADQALYLAKHAGRNQVCFASENGMDEL